MIWMNNLESNDYLSVLDTVYSANRCGDIESLIRSLCPSLSQMFHSDIVTFQLVSGTAPDFNVIESRSFMADKNTLEEDKYYPTLYKDNFYQHSPLLNGAISSFDNVLKIGNNISLADWNRSFFYNNFIMPQHLYWEIFVALRWKNSLEGMITLWRSEKNRDYDPQDVTRAEILAPHLMTAVHNINLVSRLTHWKKYYSNEGINEGIICLDHKLRPVYFNTRAREVCVKLANGLKLDNSSSEDEFPIPQQILSDCNELQDMYRIKGQPTMVPKETILITETGARFRVETTMVWKTDTLSTQPNFIVTMLNLAREQKIDLTLQNRFQLTRRELDVVYYLTSGLSYDEIAKKLFISKQTVHTHVKNIYRKIGATSRSQLFRNIRMQV